jgi:hypothetical protein
MEAVKNCPICGSLDIRLREGVLRLRIVPVVGGGPGEDRAFLVFKCLACGRGFDEIEAQEGPPSLSGLRALDRHHEMKA